MIKLEIYKAEKWLPVDVTGTPAITYQQNTVDDVRNRQMNFSQVFNLPMTDNNCRIFGFINHGYHLTDIPYTNFPVRVYEQGVNIAKDDYILYVKSVTRTINVQIHSGLKSFIERLEEFPLKGDEDNYISDLLPVVPWTIEEANAAETAFTDGDPLTYRFGLMKPGQKDPEPRDVRFMDSALFLPAQWLSVHWLRPFINIRVLLFNTLQSMGYSIETDLLTMPWYEDLYRSYAQLERGPETANHYLDLQYTAQADYTINWNTTQWSFGLSSITNIDSYGFEGGVATDFTFNYDNVDGNLLQGGQDELPGSSPRRIGLRGPKYICPIPGKVLINISVNHSPSIGDVPQDPILHFVVWNIYSRRFIKTKYDVFDAPLNENSYHTEILVDVEEGDHLYVGSYASKGTSEALESTSARSISITFTYPLTYLDPKTVEKDPDAEPETANDICSQKGSINLYWNSPYNNAAELFREFIELYNLNIALDGDIIRLYTWDRIINDEGVDWSGKTDVVNKNITKEYSLDNWGQINRVSYQEANNQIAESFITINNLNIEQEVNILEFSFAASLNSELYNDVLNNIITPSVCTFDYNIVKRTFEEIANTREIDSIENSDLNRFYYHSINYSGSGSSYLCRMERKTYENGSPAQYTMAYYRDERPSSIPPGIYRSGIATALMVDPSTITDVYYKSFVDHIISRARVLQAKALLTPFDIIKLDLMKPVIINYFGDKYYLRKINNRQGYNPCDIELIQIS